jgi:hypothetical protein
MSANTKRAEIRFYAELNDFLPRRHRFVTVARMPLLPGRHRPSIGSF